MNKLEYLKEEIINLKKDVYDNLVGNLYPSIVYNSLMKMYEEYVDLGGSINDLPFVPAPNFEGYR